MKLTKLTAEGRLLKTDTRYDRAEQVDSLRKDRYVDYGHKNGNCFDRKGRYKEQPSDALRLWGRCMNQDGISLV